MLTIEKQKQYAELAVRIGANMQVGQEVLIRSDVSTKDFAHLVAEKAYEFGAKKVQIEWNDEIMDRMTFENVDTEVICDIPKYRMDFYQYVIDHKMCLISIVARNPNNLKGIDPSKIMKANIALSTAMGFFRNATMSNLLRWTLLCVPTEAWAKTVFPNCSGQEAVDKLWEAIAISMRLDKDDPTKEWEQHIERLHRRAEFLNSKKFEYIHMTAKNGTDIKVGLADGHLWTAAREDGQDGVPFTANMPTEEIFTAPHRMKVDGVVKNALPLVNNGNIIDKFSITFKDGKVVDYSAEVGYEALKGLLSADEGVLRLGEIALIGKNSPIAEQGILFYNTLFDENASCHLAFGKGYPTTIKDGNDKTPEQLEAAGLNNSTQHVDFMIGTKDMSIEGIDALGKKTKLFEDGEWVI